jgi:5-methylcytosine-specific restriction endonuclease McrA
MNSCRICRKSFTTRHSLSRHRRHVHATIKSVQKYRQALSSAGQVRKSMLPSSLNLEKTTLKFLCVTCGKNFSRKDNLIRHHRDKHEKNNSTKPSPGASFATATDQSSPPKPSDEPVTGAQKIADEVDELIPIYLSRENYMPLLNKSSDLQFFEETCFADETERIPVYISRGNYMPLLKNGIMQFFKRINFQKPDVIVNV